MGRPIVKVCGLTRPADVSTVIAYGATFAGINGYKKSPRFVAPGSPLEFQLIGKIPPQARVWLAVEPTIGEVSDAFERGYALAQIHFDPSGTWDPRPFSKAFGSSRLWLAPKLEHPENFLEGWIGLAKTFLIDGYSPGKFGGTGKRVAGRAFANLQGKFPGQAFMLAGGLGPENVAEAVLSANARRIDVNSGVENEPGIKDAGKVKMLFENLADL